MAEDTPAAEGGGLPEDFFYDKSEFAREPPPTELPSSFAPFHHSFAFESHKLANLHYLDDVRRAALRWIARTNIFRLLSAAPPAAGSPRPPVACLLCRTPRSCLLPAPLCTFST